MKIAVVRETRPGERRVALVPESCKKLIAAGYAVGVEAGAGVAAGYPDDTYAGAGCALERDPAALLGSAGLLVKVNPPTIDPPRREVAHLKPGSVVLGSLMPVRYPETAAALAGANVTAFSTDAIPRITRAQAMDTLSSMASLNGYKGALLGAAQLGKLFPMMMTAAGSVMPAKVFVIGAAVAGLQAIATAKRLGASVTATDVRPEVKEQIESVGAKYVGIELSASASAGGGYAKELSAEDAARQRHLLEEQCAQVDVVITTALIGGVFAPRLITAPMVARMRPGAVIVDLGAEGGGNCELSRPGETVEANGVTILAPLNLPSTMAVHASLLFSRNLTAFILAFTRDRTFVLDPDDEIQKGALITRDGAVVHPRVRDALAKAGRPVAGGAA